MVAVPAGHALEIDGFTVNEPIDAFVLFGISNDLLNRVLIVPDAGEYGLAYRMHGGCRFEAFKPEHGIHKLACLEETSAVFFGDE
jgi:hypothetical protein